MIRRRFLATALGLTTANVIALPAIASEPKKKGGGAGYTQFRTVTAFTDVGRRRHGTLSVDMGLYTDNPKLTEQIVLMMPRLQDAYLTRLQSYAGGLTSQSLVDPDFISSQFQTVTDQILGQKGAKVLLGSILLN